MDLRDMAQNALDRGESVGRYHHQAVINAIDAERAATSSRPAAPELRAALDVERLAEIHWLLVNEVNRTDETYLDLLDWIEPLVDVEASQRADDRLAPSRSRD